MKSVSVRIAYKNIQQTAGQRRHDQRIGNMPKYVDRTRSGDNSVVIPAPPEADIRRRCEALREQRNMQRATKNTAAISTVGIITFSTEAQSVIRALSVEKQNELYLATAQRITDYLDTDLIGLSVHRDETAPHAHFSMLALNHDGVPLSTVIKKPHTRRIQDIAGEVMAEHGLDIKRGKSKELRIADGEDMSKWTNRTVKQLHEDIPAEIAAGLAVIEGQQATIAAQQLTIEEQQASINEKHAALERIQREIDKAEQQRDKNDRLAKEAHEKQKTDLEKRYADRMAAKEALIEEKTAELANIERQISEQQKVLDRASERVNTVILNVPEVEKPTVHNINVKTGMMSSEPRNVVFEKDFQQYKMNRDNRENKIIRATQQIEKDRQDEKLRADKLEAELNGYKKDPQLAPRMLEIQNKHRAANGMAPIDENGKTVIVRKTPAQGQTRSTVQR